MAQAHFEPTWAFIKRPGGYPVGPAVGKPELILQSQGNDKALYHRLSPYSNYHQGLISWGDEPYYYIYPDQAKKFPHSLKKYDSHIFALGSGIIDVIRTTKFLVSGRGVVFLAKQFLLQTASPYNERRIYNPTSPIVAAGLTLTLGSARPDRAFDTSAGLTGIASTLLGSLGSTIFGPPKQNPVSGTAYAINSNALPEATKTFAAKGNLRAGTALRGLANLQSQWPGTSHTGGSSSGGFLSAVKNIAKSLFQNFIPQRQSNIQFRSDEGAYGMMISSDFKFSDDNGYSFGQTWVAGRAGNINIRKKSEYTTSPYKLYAQIQNGTVVFTRVSTRWFVYYNIPTIGAVGYDVNQSHVEKKPGYRYGDSMGASKNENFEASEMMVQYHFYKEQDFTTKDPEAQRAIDTKTKLSIVLDKIKAASEKTYLVEADQNSVLLQQDSVKYNYDRLFKTKNKGQGPNNITLGSLAAYRYEGVTMLSNELVNNVQHSYKLPTAGAFDAINTLDVLPEPRSTGGSPLSGRWEVWEPYKDDLIALYFYDVVNEKYIPFRAAIKGISESGNASWEELPFIGRADKVYSYGGFNRNLSFNLAVVISSIAELAPTWQRINYMMTSYKPANYTKAKGVVASGNNAYDRFMVPPMFMLTMGDLYKDQPILIQSVTMNIPDDAAWETYNEENAGAGNWAYMANLISSPKAIFGQVPREVDLGFTVVLLEKERAVVGGANFGHAPRTEEFQKWNTDTVPDGKAPNNWHEYYVVDVIKQGFIDEPMKAPAEPPPPPPPPPPFKLLSAEPVPPPVPRLPSPISNVRTNNVAPPFNI